MQEAIKKQKGQYITIYGDEINLLNRGTVYELDKQYQLHPEKIFNNTFKEILWKRCYENYQDCLFIALDNKIKTRKCFLYM